MTSVRGEIDRMLERVGEEWSEADRDRATRIGEDLMALHAQAALGHDVDGALDTVRASMAQMEATASRQARTVLRVVVSALIEQGRKVVVGALLA